MAEKIIPYVKLEIGANEVNKLLTIFTMSDAYEKGGSILESILFRDSSGIFTYDENEYTIILEFIEKVHGKDYKVVTMLKAAHNETKTDATEEG